MSLRGSWRSLVVRDGYHPRTHRVACCTQPAGYAMTFRLPWQRDPVDVARDVILDATVQLNGVATRILDRLDQARPQPTQAAPDPERLERGDEVLTCPHCSLPAPAFSIAIGRNAVRRDGIVRIVQTGERFSCWGCGEFYAIGPNGPFKVHEKALPRIGPEPQRAAQPPKEDEIGPPPAMPMGLKRP